MIVYRITIWQNNYLYDEHKGTTPIETKSGNIIFKEAVYNSLK
jgi:hypothetical protein